MVDIHGAIKFVLEKGGGNTSINPSSVDSSTAY